MKLMKLALALTALTGISAVLAGSIYSGSNCKAYVGSDQQYVQHYNCDITLPFLNKSKH